MSKLKLVLLCLLLSGCSMFNNPMPAPVVSLTDYKLVTSGTHVVSPGETLYEIAWKYGRDYRDLAAANGLKSPYTIYPHQKINLRIATAQERQKLVHQKPSTPIKKITPAQDTKIVKESNAPISINNNETWAWPVKGKIIKHYSKQGGFKGIDIAGILNTPVVAAKSGKVVYSGNGLRGYGNLLIIKHNESFLSAYGHNDKLLVKEGDIVQKGQTVATMGKTDAESVRLHFEIRKDGIPINPESLLLKS